MLEEGKGFKQFPYYEEMRSITSLRKVKEKGGKEQAEQEEEEEEIIRMRNKSRRKKKKVEEEVGEGVADKVEWALGELTRRQREREERWLRESEAREAQRSNAEKEWRRSMGIVLEERMEMERRWRAREEERRARKEMRAEQRDRLVAAIVAQLDDNGEEGGD
ncbi:hypothetical protein HPP92_027797 [Vanilla planifolia]|uniref:Uncharacterized protein n=1 Tax=Vanilla planifolia TaxID=51239 RepID=A0A835U4J4_VANPL|nr:hypothetical protein HPP92_027797 [Vanilla planifolia]